MNVHAPKRAPLVLPRIQEAYEIVVGGAGDAPVVLTCEHASNRLPEPWSWHASDRWVVDEHWAWDPGTADLTRELAERLGATAVLARFTRLLVDANRALDAPSLFRDMADGKKLAIGRVDGPVDGRHRIAEYWRPYHNALDLVTERVKPKLVLGIHSFTPVYQGTKRDVTVGVLHAGEVALAARWVQHLKASLPGEDVRDNEPYSGVGGFMFSPALHAEHAGCPALEIEARMDLLVQPVWRAALMDALVELLEEL